MTSTFASGFGNNFHVESSSWSGNELLNSGKNELHEKTEEKTLLHPSSKRVSVVHFCTVMSLTSSGAALVFRSLSRKTETMKIAHYKGDVMKCSGFIKAASYTLGDALH